MKFMVLAIILMNVLLTPWGLSTTLRPLSILAAMGLVAIKLSVVSLVLVTIEAGFAKLRLVRNVDFITAAIVLAFLGAMTAGFGVGTL